MPNARAALEAAAEHLDARRQVQKMLTEQELMSLVFKGPLPPTPPDFRYKVNRFFSLQGDLVHGLACVLCAARVCRDVCCVVHVLVLRSGLVSP